MTYTRWALFFLSLLLQPLWAGNGPWNPTGSLQTARRGHTATLLNDGRVLVVGGESANPLKSAEIYNPDTGEWATTGALSTGRADHTATLLENGRVLIAGGEQDGTPTSSVEIYNPINGMFSEANPLATARTNHAATLLNDGRVLVTGGLGDGGSGAIASVELFNPATGNWSALSDLKGAREKHTATLLPNGHVLVAGGFSPFVVGQFSRLSTVELFNPVTSEWTTASPMTRKRADHRSVRLANGRLLIVGGAESPGSELYDISGATWMATGPPAATRTAGHSMSLLGDGRVLLLGGTAAGSVQKTVEIYFPASGLWSVAASPGEARTRHTATRLASGVVLMAGGRNLAGTTLSSSELFTPPDPAPPSLLLYPQLALGAGFKILLFVTHQNDGIWNGRARLDGGAWPGSQPWSLNGVNRSGESEFPISLGPQETRKFVLESSAGPFSGWLEIEADPGSQVQNLSTAFFYNFTSGGQLSASTGVPPSDRLVAFRFPVERAAGLSTGIAIRRAGDLKFTLYDEDGNLLDTKTQAFEGAIFFHNIFSGVPQTFIGSVKIESGVGFYLVVLRQQILNGPELMFELTSIPATPVP